MLGNEVKLFTSKTNQDVPTSREQVKEDLRKLHAIISAIVIDFKSPNIYFEFKGNEVELYPEMYGQIVRSLKLLYNPKLFETFFAKLDEDQKKKFVFLLFKLCPGLSEKKSFYREIGEFTEYVFRMLFNQESLGMDLDWIHVALNKLPTVRKKFHSQQYKQRDQATSLIEKALTENLDVPYIEYSE